MDVEGALGLVQLDLVVGHGLVERPAEVGAHLTGSHATPPRPLSGRARSRGCAAAATGTPVLTVLPAHPALERLPAVHRLVALVTLVALYSLYSSWLEKLAPFLCLFQIRPFAASGIDTFFAL